MELSECFDVITKTGFTELAISKNHLLELARLPYHHKDPFDRLLVAQAIEEKFTIITKDSWIPQYKVSVIW